MRVAYFQTIPYNVVPPRYIEVIGRGYCLTKKHVIWGEAPPKK